MNLDKRHLVASLGLLGASIVYNVWVYTQPTGTAARPAATAGGAAAPTGEPPQAESAVAAAAGPLADVALDRLPEWPRDPFASQRRRPQVTETIEPVAAPVEEADPVVASILYSPERRFAMINGRITRVGDEVAGAIVVDILPNAVVIDSPLRGRRTIPLRTPQSRVERR